MENSIAPPDHPPVQRDQALDGWPAGPACQPASARQAPGLEDLVLRLHQAFELPSLSTSHWEALYVDLASAIAKQGYDYVAMSDVVWRACLERGQRILIRQAWLVVAMLAAALAPLEDRRAESSPLELAKTFRNGVIIFCHRHVVDLSPAEDRLLDRWLLGRHDPGLDRHEQAARAVGL